MLVSWARRTSASVTTCDNFLRSSRSRTDKYFKLIVLTTSWLKKSSPSNQQTTNWGHTHACTHAVLKYDGCIAHWRNTYSIILNSQLSLVSVTTTWLYHDNGWQLQETSVVRGYWNSIMPVLGHVPSERKSLQSLYRRFIRSHCRKKNLSFPTALAVDLRTVRGLPVDRDRLVGHHCPRGRAPGRKPLL